MDFISRTTTIGAAGASGGVGSFVTEFVSDGDESTNQFHSQIETHKQNCVQLLSDGTYIASSILGKVSGTSGVMALAFTKYSKTGEVVEVKKFTTGNIQHRNYVGCGQFVYDEDTDIIYFAHPRVYGSNFSYRQIYAYNYSTEARQWVSYTYNNDDDQSASVHLYDDGDHLLVEMTFSNNSAQGHRVVSKVKKSDGLCVDTYRQGITIVDSGTGTAGPYAVDTTNNRRYTFFCSASSSSTCNFFYTDTGTTTFPALTQEFRLQGFTPDTGSYSKSQMVVQGDDVFIGMKKSTSEFDIVKLNKNTLTTTWSKGFNYTTVLTPNTTGPYHYGVDLAADSNGDLYVVQSVVRHSRVHSSTYTVKIHKFNGTNGNLLWARNIERNSTASVGWSQATNSVLRFNENDDLILHLTVKSTSDIITPASNTRYGTNLLIKIKNDGSETGNFGPINIVNADSDVPTATNAAHATYNVANNQSLQTNANDFVARASDTLTITDETNNTDFHTNQTEIS